MSYPHTSQADRDHLDGDYQLTGQPAGDRDDTEDTL